MWYYLLFDGTQALTSFHARTYILPPTHLQDLLARDMSVLEINVDEQ
jgi:hypothetical protein